VKWSFIKENEKKPVYLICNADESEPGTFKDRYIIHQDPHQLIEGMLISCFALNVHTAYIYIRGEFPEGQGSSRARSKKRAPKFSWTHILGTVSLWIFTFTAAPAPTFAAKNRPDRIARRQARYRASSRIFPACSPLHVPTIVNNVETLCHVKHIIAMGGAEYAGSAARTIPARALFA